MSLSASKDVDYEHLFTQLEEVPSVNGLAILESRWAIANKV